MLKEIVLTPDIFDANLYSSPDACDIHMRYIREPLLNEVLVRDLRSGGWSSHVSQTQGRWHPRGKELFKKLSTQSRLRQFQPCISADPASDDHWCDEAIASNEVDKVEVILSTNTVAKNHSSCALVHSVENATGSAWWQSRTPSNLVPRNINAIHEALRLEIENANSLMFIDPHLDPSVPRYRNFIRLLLAAKRTPAARLEVHRACYEGSPANRQVFTGARRGELEKRFRDSWSAQLQSAGVQVSVYVWPDLHERYLITNLIGIHVGNGFDESADPNERVMLTRLGKGTAEEVQRSVDPAVKPPHYVIQLP